MFTDPAELLPKYQHLLEIDFARLGDGSTANKQYWIESMESALVATDHIIDGGDTVNIQRALQLSTKKRRHAGVTRMTMTQSECDEGHLVYQMYWFGQTNFLSNKRTIRDDRLSGSVPVLYLGAKERQKQYLHLIKKIGWCNLISERWTSRWFVGIGSQTSLEWSGERQNINFLSGYSLCASNWSLDQIYPRTEAGAAASHERSTIAYHSNGGCRPN